MGNTQSNFKKQTNESDKDKDKLLPEELLELRDLRDRDDRDRRRDLLDDRDDDRPILLRDDRDDRRDRRDRDRRAASLHFFDFTSPELRSPPPLRRARTAPTTFAFLINRAPQDVLPDETDAYKRALAGGAMDVAYSRVLFLGTAGVGKTSFKRSLMKLPWEPNTTSTVVADVSRVRPFTREWHTLKEDKWRVVFYEDEIKELAGLILAVYKEELEGSDTTAYAHNKSSLSVPESHSNIIVEVETIISDALSYIKKNSTLPLKPQPFLHFWDCGGQPPFLEILPVFLTSRTLFFLVFDAEKDLRANWKSVINIKGERIDQEEEVHMTTLDYLLNWMANIHGHLMSYDKEGGFCEFPRMYCIGTHGDCVKDRKLEIIKELERHYQSKDFRALIEDTVIIDNTTSGKEKDEDSSFHFLREAVVRFTEEKLVLKTPLSWILFRNVIQVLSKKYSVIGLKDACIIGAASKIPAKDMHHVLMFYHELGVLLFYPQIDGMEDMIIINPNYIVDALGKIFPLSVNPDRGRYCKEWKLFHECGILVQPLYVELWGKYKDISSKIIKILVHFRIAVEVKTDQYSPPSIKQYFMPLILKSTQVNSSSMTLPSDSIQAAPLHITFNSGYVPPGFFTRFVVALANGMELWFENGVYRNHITFRYQDSNSTSIEHVTVSNSHDVIQINVIHHHPDSVSFNKICQDIRALIEDATREVEELLIKCAGGSTANNVSTQYVFKHEFKFVCMSCHHSIPPHYIVLSPINQTQLLCEKKKSLSDYRAPTEWEKVWFKDTSISQSIPARQTSSTATAKSPKGNNSKRRMEEEFLTSSDVNLLDITDLDVVHDELRSIDYTEWKELGLSLGLYHNTLGTIEEKCRGNARKCLMECMAAWLKGEDKVGVKGGPSWSSLATALEKIGVNNVARNIRAK